MRGLLSPAGTIPGAAAPSPGSRLLFLRLQASLLQRLRLLQRQEEDAKELKDHVARRQDPESTVFFQLCYQHCLSSSLSETPLG